MPQRAPKDPNPVRGRDHYRARLHDRDIPLILELCEVLGVPQRQVAREFNVSQSCIARIVSCRAWTHV